MGSKDLRAVEQAGLLLARRREPEPVAIETITKCRSMLAAINLMINVSGLEDKEIYAALGIDPGHFSHIRKGKAGVNFPLDKLNDALDLCDNEIPLVWWAHSRGKGLHLLQTEMERQLQLEREARARAEEKLAYAESLLKGR